MQSDHSFYCNYVFKHEIIMLEMCFREKKNKPIKIFFGMDIKCGKQKR